MKKDDKTPRAASPEEALGDGPSFESAIDRLEEIVEKLESGELPLEESLRLFEEGISLSKRAGALLDQAERKVEALTRAADGTLDKVPFEAEARDGEE